MNMTNIEQYPILNKQNLIEIDESLWTRMNEELGREEIKQFLSDVIENHDVRMPLLEISEEEMLQAFQDLKEFDAMDLFQEGAFTSRYPFQAEKRNEYIDNKKIGLKASNYFHQENRWKCDSINSPSPYRTWTQERFRLTLFKALWTLKYDKINEKNLRSAIGLRKYIASKFKPASAKAIYERFESRKVLDISSGWGDRLLAFAACEKTEHYTGIDPNASLSEGYQKQIETYGGDKEYRMIVGCAEEVVLEEEFFDTVFTSPPYFNVEKYTHDETQSFKKFRKVDDWLNEFLFKALDNAWKALKKGGHMIINISDVYSNHRVNQLCDPMCEHMKEKTDAEFQGAIGLKMIKRPNSKSADIDGVFAEPIFIWKKI
jgi:16S rRNA G966 N2-methylase RsmD